MFSLINFLIFTSLGLASWTLFYLPDQIHTQILENIQIVHKMDEPTACHDNYDIILNVICVFACIYCLAKVTNMAESYIGKHVHEHAVCGQKCARSNDVKAIRSIDELREEQANLKVQAFCLEQQNCKLKETIRELQKRNYEVSGRLVQLSRQVSIKELKLPLDMPSDMPLVAEQEKEHDVDDVQEEEGPTDIWTKYLQIHKYAIQQTTDNTVPAMPSYDLSTKGLPQQEPQKQLLIISTAELQNATTQGKYSEEPEELLKSLALY